MKWYVNLFFQQSLTAPAFENLAGQVCHLSSLLSRRLREGLIDSIIRIESDASLFPAGFISVWPANRTHISSIRLRIASVACLIHSSTDFSVSSSAGVSVTWVSILGFCLILIQLFHRNNLASGFCFFTHQIRKSLVNVKMMSFDWIRCVLDTRRSWSKQNYKCTKLSQRQSVVKRIENLLVHLITRVL